MPVNQPSKQVKRFNYANFPECDDSARLAQSVEHETLNLRVVGSSPTLGANVFCIFLFSFLFFFPNSCHFFSYNVFLAF